MHMSGTEAIRTQIQPLKPKREIIYITYSQNTMRKYGQSSEQFFSKRWPLSIRTELKLIQTHITPYKIHKGFSVMYFPIPLGPYGLYSAIIKVKRHRNSDNKNRQQRTITKLPPWNGQ